MRVFGKNYKKGQEEMVGFGLIIIIVAVILLVFLAIYLNKSKTQTLGENEANSFVQAVLPYTTDCMETSRSYYSVQDLIKECAFDESLCADGIKNCCEVLNSTLKKLIDSNWEIGEDTPIKGYDFNILVEEEPLISLREGNTTNSYKGAMQEFSFSGNSVVIEFSAYY